MRFIRWILCLYISVHAGSVLNFEAEGNLERTHSLGCIAMVEIKNSYTPADLFYASARCTQEEKYSQAVELYLVATAYGYFDAYRVSDASARQALNILKMESFGKIDEAKRNFFAEALRTRLDDMSKSCLFLEKLGKPNYYPKYMVKHGIQAFMKKEGDGLVPNYDANTLWNDTRFNYLKCPK